MNEKVKKLTYSGILVALAILLPQVFHIFGGATSGKVFLPMHIPILLAGMILGPFWGCAVAIISPILSSIFTGMPAVPYLYFMIFELVAYGIISGLLSKKLNVYLNLILTLIGGRAFYAVVLLMAGGLFHIDAAPPVASVIASISTGIPGLIIQLIFIPPIYLALKKSGLLFDKKSNVIKKLKKSGANCCVITAENKIITSELNGIKPILSLIDENKAQLQDAYVADRVIGKAAAMLLIDSGIKYIYGEIMSEAADAILTSSKVRHSYKQLVPYIINRTGDGLCPMEQSVLELEDPALAYDAVVAKLEALKNQSK